MNDLKEQFGSIYDQYIEKIYRFVYLKVNSKPIAEDITSNVFLRGWEFFLKNEGQVENPSAFLYKIANNLVVDYYRQSKKNYNLEPEVLKTLPEEKKNPQSVTVFAEDKKYLENAIKQLDETYQNVIIWRYLEDMSISDIAGILGKSESAVRVIAHRGLKKLKEIMGDV